MSSTLLALRASSEANSAEQKRQAERRRNILVLINAHLIENGYVETAERLQSEAGSVIGKFDAADNIDMSLIFSEFEAYYEMRFDKKPKLVRKLQEGEEQRKPVGRPPRLPESSSAGSSASIRKPSRDGKKDSGASASGKLPSVNGATPTDDDNSVGGGGGGLGVQGTSMGGSSVDQVGKKKVDDAADRFEERVLKPPPQFNGDGEMRQLAAVISREIYQESPNVRFEDIVQLDEAKRLLVEAVQLPLRFPTLFTGILRPWKGILLHGPPGTGKTLLAKAVATECHTTFFNISASTLVSKWRGDSEKLVRCLFEVARYHAPSTVFLDEIDSILTSRGAEGGEHEASRRMKTELLIQMDGVKGAKVTELVFVMAASNLPWDLDIAVLRRLEKRVLVGLPVAEARECMIRKHLVGRAGSDLDYATIAGLTEGYSGADIELVCREAAMRPVRRLVQKIRDLEVTGGGSGGGSNRLPEPAPTGSKSSSSVVRAPLVAALKGGVGAGVGVGVVGASSVDAEALLRADPVTQEDLRAALETTKSSSDGGMDKYLQWQNEYGAV